MKCPRCQSELPSQAQFCLRCGSPVAAAPYGATAASRPMSPAIHAAAPPARSRAGLIAGVSAILVIAAIAAFLGLRRGNVTNALGRVPEGSRIMDTTGRVGRTAPLTTSAGTPGPAPLDPADVIDYLKFLKEIERQRITLVKSNEGTLKTLVPMTEGGNIMAQMQGNEADISRAQNQTYSNIQSKISDMSNQWLELSTRFQQRRPPQSCQQLANYYYDALGKTSAAIISVANAFSQAMQGLSSGDMSKVSGIVEKLQGMDGSGTGSPSQSVDSACDKADSELASVCDKFRIHKDFDIRSDGGGASPFGLGR
jgi:hypothetical protein